MKANAPTLKANKNQLERVQRLATRQVRGLRHVPYAERLRQLTHFSQERRRLRAHLILTFQIFKGKIDLNPSDFFLRKSRAGLRWHTYLLLQGPSRLRCRSGVFSVRLLTYWNRFPVRLVTLTIYLQYLSNSWSVSGPKSFLHHLYYFPIHFPIQRNFSLHGHPRLLMFSLALNPQLVYVFITCPTIHQ